MQDAWYGHRDFYFEEYGDRNEWIDWDYALAAALQTLEDLSDQNGIPVWESESERVDIQAKKKIDKFQASIDRKTKGTDKKPYKAEPGESWVPDVSLRGSGDFPTYREYVNRIRLGEDAPEEDWGDALYGKSWQELQVEEED